MKKLTAVLFAAVLLSAVSYAHIVPVELTETPHCGDGIREGYELCEPDTDQNLCPEIGRMLGIAMVCNELKCNCLPPEIKDCGNGILEGTEMCDPGTKEEPVDYCPLLSEMLGLEMECNAKTCDCEPVGTPKIITKCGDGIIEGNEQCEDDSFCPKGRHCENCRCVRDVEPAEIVANITPVEKNVTIEPPEIPSVKEIVTKDGKTVISGVVLDDLVGTVLPEDLRKYREKRINIRLTGSDGSNKTVGVVTSKGVVQEVHPVPINRSQLEVFVSEEQVQQVLKSEKKALKISLMLETEEIVAKPTGIFRRFFYWLTHLFK